MLFKNRQQAGRALAKALVPHLTHPAIVYGLPRGGVPIAVEIARHFHMPMDLVIPRKLGHPTHPEYAIGAVTEHGRPILSESERHILDPLWLQQKIDAERREAGRRRLLYCGGRPRESANGKCAILVDDGIATGLTMQAALEEIRADGPTEIIVAVPVSPGEIAERFTAMHCKFVAVDVPDTYLGSVGAYYEDFRQLSDEDVLSELARLRPEPARKRHAV